MKLVKLELKYLDLHFFPTCCVVVFGVGCVVGGVVQSTGKIYYF